MEIYGISEKKILTRMNDMKMYLEYKERIECLEGILRRNNPKEYKGIILRSKRKKTRKITGILGRKTRKKYQEAIF